MPTDVGTLTFRLADSGIVAVSVEGSPAAWAQIKLSLLEDASSARLVGGNTIEVPWWDLSSKMSRLSAICSLHPGLKVEADEKTRERISRTNSEQDDLEAASKAGEVSENELIKTLRAVKFGRANKLTKHQIKNVRRLAALPNGATFSVPGAGKTTEALATFAFKTKLKANLLIVSPKNAFAAWDEQVAECLPGNSVVRLVGGANIAEILRKKPKLAIISYSQLSFVAELIQQHLAENPSVVFLDESHKIKGGEHKAWASAALSISHLAQWKLIMSGTPMPNGPEDLISQIRFLYPKLGYPTDPIATIQRFFVRTTKTDLNLPPVIPKGIPIPLTDDQARLYQLCATEVARDAEQALHSADKMALRKLGNSYMLLLQLVSNPSLLAGYQGRFEDKDLAACIASESPKIAYTCHRARQLASEGKKVLIWSTFVQNVEVIAQRLADVGADYIHGDVEAGNEDEEATRENKVRRFRKDNRAMVLVANPAACSEGISLHTVCHHAIYVDRNYNAAQFLQSADRIHRYGLKPHEKTFIEFVYSPGTIDESVIRRLDFKIRKMEEALKDRSISLPTHWFADLDEMPDAEDIRDLLSTIKKGII